MGLNRDELQRQHLNRLQFIIDVLRSGDCVLPDEMERRMHDAGIKLGKKYGMKMMSRDIFELREAGNTIDYRRNSGYHLVRESGRLFEPRVPYVRYNTASDAPRKARGKKKQPETRLRRPFTSPLTPICAAAKAAGCSYGAYVWRTEVAK